MEVLKTVDGEISKVIDVLQNEGVIIYPTDTLYGLGADATSEKAKERIYKIKGRNFGKPLSICFSGIDQADEYVVLDEFSLELARKFLPGPLTLVVRQRKEVRYVSKDGKIAVRVPDNRFMIKVLERFGKPVTSTSANISGETDPIKISDINPSVLEKCDLVIDDGMCKFRKPSTVFDVESKQILREGAITKEQLLDYG